MAKGKFHTKNPQPADQIFFGNASNVRHTGIVEEVTDTQVITIEGNADDQVKRCTYSLNSSDIYGYGTPRWELLEPYEIPQEPVADDGGEEPVEPSEPVEEDKYDPLDFHPIVCMMYNSTCYK